MTELACETHTITDDSRSIEADLNSVIAVSTPVDCVHGVFESEFCVWLAGGKVLSFEYASRDFALAEWEVLSGAWAAHRDGVSA